MAPDPSQKQTLNLPLSVIRQFLQSVGGNVLLNHAVSSSLA